MKARYLLYPLIIISLLFAAACEDDTDLLPEEDPRDKFLGVWKVNEDCIRLNYDVNILYNPDNSSQVLIENFANPGPGYPPAVALVVGDRIFVEQQVIGDNWNVSGDGTLDSGVITWEYDLLIGGNLYQCSSTYSR